MADVNSKIIMTDQYTCKKEGVYMSWLKVNNIYIEQEYAYIPEAQECMQPLHSHVNIH